MWHWVLYVEDLLLKYTCHCARISLTMFNIQLEQYNFSFTEFCYVHVHVVCEEPWNILLNFTNMYNVVVITKSELLCEFILFPYTEI